jgi:hypothetical protein
LKAPAFQPWKLGEYPRTEFCCSFSYLSVSLGLILAMEMEMEGNIRTYADGSHSTLSLPQPEGYQTTEKTQAITDLYPWLHGIRSQLP